MAGSDFVTPSPRHLVTSSSRGCVRNFPLALWFYV